MGFNPRTHTGCDEHIDRVLAKISKFQSTHPHGVRHDFRLQPLCKLDVSIHAPTRGATTTMRKPSLTNTGFNPRTHTGCDIVAHQVGVRVVGVSIHAPTRGATLVNIMSVTRPKFQSTHPHGVRPIHFLQNIFCYLVSIHAPTRGATKNK